MISDKMLDFIPLSYNVGECFNYEVNVSSKETKYKNGRLRLS